MFSEIKKPEEARGSLVFIHGAGGEHSLWQNQMADLPPGFAGYALDLPGHGQSEGEPVNDIAVYAAAVAEFIQQEAVPRPVYLVGQSMGTAIALTVALRRGEVIDGLILMAGGARMKVAPALLESLAAGQGDPAFLRLAFSPHTEPALVDEFMARQADVPVNTFLQDFSACNVFDVTQEVEQIKLPTMVIVGVDDRLTPVKLSQYLHENIPGSVLKTIQQAGHMPMVEKPQEVNELIKSFVNG